MHFGPLKILLGSRRVHNNQEMLSCAVHKRFLTRRPDLYRDGFFKLAPKRDKFIGVAGDYKRGTINVTMSSYLILMA